jgi:hypothetical protein
MMMMMAFIQDEIIYWFVWMILKQGCSVLVADGNGARSEDRSIDGWSLNDKNVKKLMNEQKSFCEMVFHRELFRRSFRPDARSLGSFKHVHVYLVPNI